jgi:hypothetical protein
MKNFTDSRPKKKPEIISQDFEIKGREPRKPRFLPTINETPTDYETSYNPFKIPEEWNEKETRKMFETENNSEEIFWDPYHDSIFLPPSFNHVRWYRPEFYIREDLLQKEISFIFPNKNTSKLSRYIRDMYSKNISVLEKNVSASVEIKSPILIPMLVVEDNEDLIESMNNKKIFREFYKILERQLDIKVVNVSHCENEDRDDKRFEQIKFEKNLKKLKMNIKGEKNKINHVNTISNNHVLSKLSSISSEIEEISGTKIKPNPGNIDMKDKYIDFSRWVGSIYQTIKDLNILDCEVNKF